MTISKAGAKTSGNGPAKGASKAASVATGQGSAKRARTDLACEVPPKATARAVVEATAGAVVEATAGAVVLDTARATAATEPSTESASTEPPAVAGVAVTVVVPPEAAAALAPPGEAGLGPLASAQGSGESWRAGAASPTAAAPVSSPEAAQPLVCEAAAAVLAKYSRGIQRIPLERMGISPFNRRINGPYVHKLGRRILSIEGFARLRYRSGWCHEPNPDDELSVARFTNAAAMGSGLLAPVPMAPLFGSFAKSHLLSFLQALKSGQVFWDQTGDLMVPAPASDELLEHLQHGMFYEVLAWEAARDHAEALRALIAADNFDAGFALGQTEMHLLQHLRTAIVVARPPVGQSVWDVVRSQIERTSGQLWQTTDMVAFFNFAKVVGDAHLQFLADLVDTHVAVDRIAVRPGDFKSAAALPVEAPWVKIALLAMQYMSPPDRLQAGPRGRSFGNVIDRAAWERLSKATAEQLEPVERFLRGVLERYALENMRGVSRRTWGQQIPGLFCRVGAALAKDLSSAPAALQRIEVKLRSGLQHLAQHLPAPVLQTALAPEAGGGCGASCSGGRSGQRSAGSSTSAVADAAPAATFADGALVYDFAAVARSKGLVPGAAVRCVRAHGGVAIDACGTVEKLEAERLMVLWEPGSSGARLCPCTEVACLLAVEAKKAPAGAGAEKGPSPDDVAMARAKALLALPRGLAWTAGVDCDARQGMADLLSGVLWQLHQSHYLSTAELRFWEEPPRTSPSLACAAQVDWKARRLVVVPFPATVRPDKPADLAPGSLCIPVSLTFGPDTDTMWLVSPPSRQERKETETPSGPVRVIYPFWDIMCARPGRGQALACAHEMVDIPIGTFGAAGALKFKRPGQKRSLRASVPFWTNAEEVTGGSRVWAEAPALWSGGAAAAGHDAAPADDTS